VRSLLRSPGKPLHPPLTDASIGAYTAGVAMLVLGALGVEEEPMAHGSLLAISLGLILTAPTALTGILDWLDIPRGVPARTVATIHLGLMIVATVLFALTWLAQLGGYQEDEVRGLALALGLAAFGFLVLGGNIGGANVFVYGIRVLKAEDTPPREALNPFGVGGEKAPRGVPAPAAGANRDDPPATDEQPR
jgi:uncharacterized membrane protein